MRSRLRLPVLIAAAALTSLGLSSTVAAARSRPTWSGGERPVLTVAQVRRLAAHATDRWIIIFKNQLTNLAARRRPRRRRCWPNWLGCTRRT
jgi:hypothetical protein